MRLADWIGEQPRGALSRLQREVGIAWPSMYAIYSGEATPRYETARKISLATGGAVSIPELCEPEPAATPRKRITRKRTTVRKAAKRKATRP